MVASPILGAGHGLSRSLNLAANQLINLYQTVRDTKDGKAPGALFTTPGLDLIATCGTGGVRATRVVKGTMYVVSGNGFYAVSTGYGVTRLGSLVTNSGPVSIIDNGPFGQIAMFDGVGGYLYTIASHVFANISLPFTGPVQATYQDDFGLVYAMNTQEWFQSQAGDLSIWTALAFTSADGSPDNVNGIVSIHREVWVMKAQHTEVWINAGNVNFAFSRLDGVFLEEGCAAPYSIAKGGKNGENLFWLAANESGQGRVVVAQGYAATTVSSVEMSTEMATYATISDAIGFCYEQEGEQFYMLAFPTAGQTWCYAIRAGRWHKRALWANGVFSRHPANCYAFFNGRCMIGDYASGNIYAFNLDNQTDNGAQRKWLRVWRALDKSMMRPARFNYLMVDMETGSAPQGTNPQIMLRWSDDGGHTWQASQLFLAAGQAGQYAQRVKFNRLGSTKKNAGLDRIFELSSTDPFKVAILGAEVG